MEFALASVPHHFVEHDPFVVLIVSVALNPAVAFVVGPLLALVINRGLAKASYGEGRRK